MLLKDFRQHLLERQELFLASQHTVSWLAQCMQKNFFPERWKGPASASGFCKRSPTAPTDRLTLVYTSEPFLAAVGTSQQLTHFLSPSMQNSQLNLHSKAYGAQAEVPDSVFVLHHVLPSLACQLAQSLGLIFYTSNQINLAQIFFYTAYHGWLSLG